LQRQLVVNVGALAYIRPVYGARFAHLAWMNSARQLAYQANVLDVRTFTSLSCRRFTLFYHPVDVCNSRKERTFAVLFY